RRDVGVEVGIAGEDVLHLLHGAGGIVVGVERAAVDLGPAVVAVEALAGRSRAAHAAERVADALHALVVVGRGSAARLDADGAAVGFDLLHELRQVDADVVVFGADVGDPEIGVLGQEIAVPGQHRDAGLLGLHERADDARGIGRADRDAVDLTGDQVVDHLQLLFAAAVLAGPD